MAVHFVNLTFKFNKIDKSKENISRNIISATYSMFNHKMCKILGNINKFRDTLR